MVLVNWEMVALCSPGLSLPRHIYAPTALNLLLVLKAFVSLLWACAPAALPSTLVTFSSCSLG